MRDHYRVESAVSATSSGNLTYEKWPHDVATALGFAGQRNPLGFAVVRYLSDTPSAVEVWNVVLVLATILGKKGQARDAARESAWQAFEWWRDRRCPICHGRGNAGISQKMCMPCSGSGERAMPAGTSDMLLGISELIEAEHWMERQLGYMLKGQQYAPEPDGHKVNLRALNGMADRGFNGRADTGSKGHFDGD